MKVEGDYWFIAPFYRQAKEIAWQMLIKMLPNGVVMNTNETELSVTLKNGSSIKLKGADNPEALKGVGLKGCILDEYAFMKPYVWQEIVRPMLFDSGGWCIFISTPYGYNHFYELYEYARDKPDWSRFHFSTYDNPLIKNDEIDASKAEMSADRFNQEIMAEFTKKSGAVWQNFQRKTHVVPRSPVKGTIFGSIDFGFGTGHPVCVQWHDARAEESHMFDGFMEEGLNIDAVDKYMKVQTTGLTVQGIFPDVARPDLIEELKRRGWPILETIKDVELGISKVDQVMQINPLTQKPGWTMSDHLTTMIEQIEQYVWQEVRGEDGKYKQAPKKEDDDACDALRYFIASYNNQPKKPQKQYTMTGGDPVTGFGRRRVAAKRGIEAEMDKLYK